MGADNLEVCATVASSTNIRLKTIPYQNVPLYMHKALSVLRELGPEKFSYKGEHSIVPNF